MSCTRIANGSTRCGRRSGVAGIEFIRSRDGEILTYDVNTNTNYNSAAEQRAAVPVRGMDGIVDLLIREWQAEMRPSAVVAVR